MHFFKQFSCSRVWKCWLYAVGNYLETQKRKSLIRESLNLSMCANSSTNICVKLLKLKLFIIFLKSGFRCHLSGFRSPLSCVTCPVSPVTCLLLHVTAMDPPPANSPSMHIRMLLLILQKIVISESNVILSLFARESFCN